MSSILNSLIESLEDEAVVADIVIPTSGVRKTISDLVTAHNESTLPVRQISLDTAYEVAERSLVASGGRNSETRKFLAIRDVMDFLSLAAEGKTSRGVAENKDLLPIAHPLSAAAHTLTAAGIRHARARWIAADLRIDESVRPLVASAYAARPESAERVYFFAKIQAAGDLIPTEIKADTRFEALLAAANPYKGGNSRAARSARARAQRRDSKGRFAFMGGAVRIKIQLADGRVVNALVYMVGNSDSEDSIEVVINNVEGVDDGIYTVPTSNIQAIKAVLDPEDVDDLPTINKLDPDLETIPLAAFASTKKESPSGWNLDPNYKKESDSDPDKRFISEDGYIVDYYASYSGKKSDPAFKKQSEIEGGAAAVGMGEDGKFAKGEPVYVLKRDASIYKGEGETEVVARVQGWGQVQVAARNDEEKFDKVIEDAPDELNQADVAKPEGYTGDDYLAAVAAKSKKNIATIDKALRQYIAQNPQKVGIANIAGDSETPVADMIKALAEPNADAEALTTKLMQLGFNLPQTDDFKAFRDAITSVVDAAIELEEKDLQKAKDKVKAVLPAKSKDEVKTEAMKLEKPKKAPSELDKIDAEAGKDGGDKEPPTTPAAPAGEDQPEVPEGLIANDPDLSLKYGMSLGPYQQMDDKSGLPEGATDDPAEIAKRFKTGLADAFEDAVRKDKNSMRLNMGNGAYNVDLDAVRDALQIQGVDTNEILAKIDAGEGEGPKNFDFVTKEQAAKLPAGTTIVRVGTEPGVFVPGVTAMFKKDEDGKWYSGVGKEKKEASLDLVFGGADGNADFQVVQISDWHKATSDQPLEELEALLEQYRAEAAAYTGGNKEVAALYKRRAEWVDSMIFFNKSKTEAEKKKAAAEAYEAIDWTTLEVGDDTNKSFVENSPVGTVLKGSLDYVQEGDEYYEDGIRFTKVGEGLWEAEGHPDYNGKQLTTEELLKNQDIEWLNIDEIPDAPTAAARAENPDAPVDLSGYKKISGPQGSNAGGIYEDENGQQFYVKFPQSKLHGENEALASALYRALGIPVADVRWGKLDGQDVTYSPMLPEAKADLKTKLDDEAYLGEIQEGFAADAWLANWDVAGTGFDNIVTSKGKPVRIDTGGALIFRAQGGEKGEAFDEKATEIDTLVSGKNQYSEAVFGDMTEIDKAASAKRLLNISDEQVAEIVSKYVSDPAVAEDLTKKLKARRKNILDRFELSAVLDKEEAVGSIISRTSEGGSTVDFVDGSSPATGFIVAMEPDVPQQDGTLGKREEVYDAEDFFDVEKGPQILRDFAIKNAEKLREDGFFLGTWFDKDNNKVYLDVSEVAPTQEEALKRAEERGEISVYDIETGEYVYTEKGKETLNGQEGTPAQDSDAETSEGPSADDGAGAGPVGSDESPAVDELDSAPAGPEATELEGYTYAQTANGVYYPETPLTADDLYALRNGTKVPPQVPFIPKNTESGDTLYFDENGVKRWGQYGAAGALIRRKNENGDYEYLVVKRNAKAATDGDVWSVPGGAHDNKDDAANPVKTASRELLEEMGWKVPEGTEAETFKHKVANDWAYDYAVIDVDNEVTPKLSKEITETKFVSAEELKQMQTDGTLHGALDAETLDKLLFLAGDNTEFKPVQLSDGKWWTPDFNEDGSQKAFRKDKSSTLKKGDIVTVKGSTGERDVVVTSEPVIDGDKVSFDALNPANGKSYSYTWDANSESSILSDNESAKQYITEAPAQEEAPADVTPKPSKTTITTQEYGSLAVTSYSDDTTKATWGKNTAYIEPSVNGTYEATVEGPEAGSKKKATFPDTESAVAWVGDLVAQEEGNELNSVTTEPVGEASKGVSVHKGKMLEPATEAQVDAIKKMIAAKDITPERKEQILNLLTKDDLSKGEIGLAIGELKSAKTLPEEQLNPTKPLPEGEQSKISVGDKEITQVENAGGKFFVTADGTNLGAVMPSQSKSGAWTAITQDGDISTIKMADYTTEDAALDAFGEHHASSGMFAENPFGTVAEEVAPEAETSADLAIDDENNDLTPKDPTDILEPNLIFDEVVKNFDHEVMPNGDLKIAESTHTMKQGDKETYKYEAFVRRTKFERFYVYVIETNMSTGEKRVLKVGRREHHSYKALTKSIAKGKGGVLSSNPRTFFQHDKKLIQPFKSVAEAPESDVTESLVSFVSKDGGPKSAAELSTALSDFFGGLTNGNYNVSKEVLDAMASDAGLPPAFVDQVLDIMAKNKAKAAASLPDTFFGKGKDVPSAPHVSYDGETIVKKGDTVDWTDPKTGKVYRGYVVNIRYMHDSKKYLYSDQTLAIFPELNKEQGYEETRQRHRVSSNLIVVDPSAPLSEPFFPKAKEAGEQEDVTTGETQPFTPKAPTPAQAPKTPVNNEVPKPATNYEDDYTKIYKDGDIVKDPETGELGKVSGSWVGPGGIQGGTIEWSGGDKQSFTDDSTIFNQLEKMPEGTTIEAAKKPVPQTNDAPELQTSPNGVPFVEVDGVQHPLYNSFAEISSNAIDGTNSKKKWSELAAGDLVFNGDKWMHVVASGFGEDGNYRVVVDSFDPDGSHVLKVMSITPEKKAFLDLHPAAVVKPTDAKVPGSVKLENEIDMSAEADSILVDKFEKLVNDYNISQSEELEAALAGVVAKQMFGETITNGEITDAIKKIEEASDKGVITSKHDDAVSADELQDAIQSLEDKLSDSSVAEEISDVAKAVETAVPTVKENESALGEDNDGYPVKKVEFDNISTKGGKKALFSLMQKVKSSDIKVGDIIRQGVGTKTRYKQVVETNVGGVRGKIAYRWIWPTDSSYSYANYSKYPAYKGTQYEGLYKFNTYKVYRPTPDYIAAGYLNANPSASVSPTFEAKVVDGISVQPTQAAVTSLGVDKKSEAGYANFGITGEINDLPYEYVPGSVSNISLWKHGFDNIKVKTANSKYVIPGAVVTSADGNSTGIVTDTDQGSATLSVTWLQGTEAGQNQSGLLANSVNDTENWVTPESAGSVGVSVNVDKLNEGKQKIANQLDMLKTSFATDIENKKKQLADKLAAEKAAKELAAKKAKETVTGSGAEILEVVPVIGWDESAYPELPSLVEAINQSKNQTGFKSSFGQDVLVDSDNVEDNVLTVSAVEKNGKPATKLNFTLTSWTTDDTSAGAGFLSSLENNPDVKKRAGLVVQQLESQGPDKLLKDTDSNASSYYLGGGGGQTYEITLRDESGKAIGTARILRANKDNGTPKFVGIGTTNSGNPLAYHNKVEVIFDDIATPAQIEQALKAAGVQQVRPATTIDTKIMLENRIISLFADMPDGSKNLTGEARQQALDNAKNQFGLTAESMKPRVESGNIHFLMPDDVATKMATALDFKKITHGFAPPSWGSGDKLPAYLYEEFFGNGTGGIRSAADRALHGIYFTPGSGQADVNNIGGGHVFVGKNASSHYGSGRPVKFYIDPKKVISRLGIYGNSGDAWGKLNGNQMKTLAESHLAEIMVKGEVPYADMLKVELANSSVRNAVIAFFQSKGISEINGVPLAQFFVV